MQRAPTPPRQIATTLTTPSSTLRAGVAGSLLAAFALPPLGLFWLVWLAPVPWLTLIEADVLPGRRPWRSLWLAGAIFWLLAVHWIRLPHPMNYLAWLALASYLGLYLPTFVLLAREGVHRFHLPLVLVAPVAWTGLDWLRGHLLTGFLMGSLAHTQYKVPVMIQIADLVGEYGVTFLIILVAAGITSGLVDCGKGHPLKRMMSALVPAMAIIAALIYGFNMRLEARKPADQTSGPRIALIQGNTPADWKMDDARQQEIMQEYAHLSREAVRESRERDGRGVDLVVWPETAFRQNLISVEEGFTPPAGRLHESALIAAKTDLAELVRQVGCAALVGLDRIEVIPDIDKGMSYHGFNSAVLVDKAGEITAIYDKMHRVVFGEFIPFADWFPILYRLTPLTGGIVAGTHATAMRLGTSTAISPNICYETVVPHLIRHHVLELANVNLRPDVLLNLTNDAWFWGSSELDMHLACGVFRAVENRTPLLIAANGGLSAHVDHLGNIQQISPRRETAILLVDLENSPLPLSIYTRFGDWFADSCVVCCAVLAFAAVQRTLRPSSDALHRG